jgi:hypothetical protein
MSFSLRSRASGGVEERLVVFSIEGARDLLPDGTMTEALLANSYKLPNVERK